MLVVGRSTRTCKRTNCSKFNAGVNGNFPPRSSSPQVRILLQSCKRFGGPKVGDNELHHPALALRRRQDRLQSYLLTQDYAQGELNGFDPCAYHCEKLQLHRSE
ncbi:hypothetical protein J6590_085093 [Homalodisca vitripennis]|nr:hypothetical protein J6590_085093 [Homalodisca vitripennis]